ncbi:MAG: LuxR C-terminal-related transcriptional regulator [Adlercreutzia equolifaciens]
MTAVRDAPSAAIEPLPRFLHLCYLGLAFFWACSMLTFRSSILLTGAADTPQYNTLIVVVSFLANMTVLLGVSALVERAPENLAKLSPWPFCGCILVGIAAIGGAGIWFAGPALSASLVIGSTLCGVGFGYLWGSWADVLGRVHPRARPCMPRRRSCSPPSSFSPSTPSWPSLPSAPCAHGSLPIASVLRPALPYESSQPSVLLAPHRTESQRYLAALTTLVPLIIAALVFSCLFGFMWETAVLSVNSASTAHELPLVLNFVVAVLLLAFTVALQRRVNLSLVYQLLIPIAIVLFAALPFFWNVHPVVLNAIMSAVHGVFDVVIWYLVATAAYDYAVSGFVIGGLVRALSILARLVGIGIGYLIMLLPEVAGYAVVGVCIGAVYLLVILLWFLWHNAKRSVPGEEAEGRMAIGEATGDGNANPHSSVSDPSSVLAAPTAVKATDKAAADPASTSPVAESISTSATAEIDGAEAINSEEVVFALLADDYGLTRREAEVLPYLARGRSAKVIAEALFVSESTIRTHTRRILEKTCLHSKQELIDLVEKY